jgi:hypothetical protein
LIANSQEQGIDLVVKIEIEAVASKGFDENKVRTVAENAKTLKAPSFFEQPTFGGPGGQVSTSFNRFWASEVPEFAAAAKGGC